MRVKQFKKIIILIIMILTIFGVLNITQVHATSAKISENITDYFKAWKEKSDEEKNSTILPNPYSLTIEDSVKRSVLNGFYSKVGGNSNSSYYLGNDIEFQVKEQGNTNECWAFSTTTLLETNLLKTRNKNLILSPRHIDYATSRTFLDGINPKGYNREVGFGNFFMSLAYCTSGMGPVLEEDMPFEDNQNKVNLSQIDKEPVLKLDNYVNFADIYKERSGNTTIYYDKDGNQYTKEQVDGVRDLIKEHIRTYGAVSGFFRIANLEDYISSEAGIVAYYNSDSSKTFDHAVTIVGWNDNFPKENFKDGNEPTEDGAYLVLNTSTAGYTQLSALAVSYEDVNIDISNYGIISTSDIEYDKIYQYDNYGFNMALDMLDNNENTVQEGYIANVFEREDISSQKDEYLDEVSIYVPKTTNVDIYLNTESDSKNNITKVAAGGILQPGYHTIELATPIKLTGENFVIAAKLASDSVKFATETNPLSNGFGSTYYDFVTSGAGQSFISTDGQQWADLKDSVNNSNVCLKAFTHYEERTIPEPTPTPTSTPTPTPTPTPNPTATPTQEQIGEIKVEKITLKNGEYKLKVGESTTIVTTITPSNATNKNVKWSSSDTSVAKVTQTGIVTAVKVGTATITATTEDGNKVATARIVVDGNIPKEDEVYYPEAAGSNTDTTTAKGTIPQTGELVLITIGIIIIMGVIITITIIKIRKLKEVK